MQVCTEPRHGTYKGYTIDGCRCVECTRANRDKQRAYYATPKGKAVFYKMQKTRTRMLRDWVAEQKASWCLDCGYVGPPEAMDFDHRPGEVKVDDLCRMVRRRCAKTRMAQEILKCDLVCANCHRIRTTQRHREKAAA